MRAEKNLDYIVHIFSENANLISILQYRLNTLTGSFELQETQSSNLKETFLIWTKKVKENAMMLRI